MRCLASARALSKLARATAQLPGSACQASSLLHQPFTPRQSWPHDPLTCAPKRSFATEEPDQEEEVRTPGNPKVRQIVEEILSLNLLEVADLTQILSKKLNIQPGSFSPGFGQPQPPQQVLSLLKKRRPRMYSALLCMAALHSSTAAGSYARSLCRLS